MFFSHSRLLTIGGVLLVLCGCATTAKLEVDLSDPRQAVHHHAIRASELFTEAQQTADRELMSQSCRELELAAIAAADAEQMWRRTKGRYAQTFEDAMEHASRGLAHAANHCRQGDVGKMGEQMLLVSDIFSTMGRVGD